MNLKENTIFIFITLCLFFPLGLVFLICSSMENRRKLIWSGIGFIVFLILLALALLPALNHQTSESNFEIIITKSTLQIGESGGFSICRGNTLLTDYSIQTDNNCIELNQNVYTAKKQGKCTVTITIGEISKNFIIEICGDSPKDSTVYLSPSGKRYHNTQSHAGKNAIKMSEYDALMSGKTPCKICYKEKANN